MDSHEVSNLKCAMLFAFLASIIVPAVAVMLFQRMPVGKMLKSFWRAGLLISACFLIAGAFWPTEFQFWRTISQLSLTELTVIHCVLQLDIIFGKIAAGVLTLVLVYKLAVRRFTST